VGLLTDNVALLVVAGSIGAFLSHAIVLERLHRAGSARTWCGSSCSTGSPPWRSTAGPTSTGTLGAVAELSCRALDAAAALVVVDLGGRTAGRAWGLDEPSQQQLLEDAAESFFSTPPRAVREGVSVVAERPAGTAGARRTCSSRPSRTAGSSLGALAVLAFPDREFSPAEEELLHASGSRRWWQSRTPSGTAYSGSGCATSRSSSSSRTTSSRTPRTSCSPPIAAIGAAAGLLLSDSESRTQRRGLVAGEKRRAQRAPPEPAHQAIWWRWRDLQSGTIHLNRRRLSLDRLIADAVASMKPLLEERRQTLEVRQADRCRCWATAPGWRRS